MPVPFVPEIHLPVFEGTGRGHTYVPNRNAVTLVQTNKPCAPLPYLTEVGLPGIQKRNGKKPIYRNTFVAIAWLMIANNLQTPRVAQKHFLYPIHFNRADAGLSLFPI